MDSESKHRVLGNPNPSPNPLPPPPPTYTIKTGYLISMSLKDF